jgi:hypothetical protein|tara:strand:+ start:10479 stop:10766 length:288 start_codon:yes stop_codon:yes gene_type:complete
MSKEIIYTFEYRINQGETLKLMCGIPWGECTFDDAVKLFTKYVSKYLNKTIDPVYIKPYMARGYFVTNKNSKYLTLPHLPQIKVDPNEYYLLLNI